MNRPFDLPRGFQGQRLRGVRPGHGATDGVAASGRQGRRRFLSGLAAGASALGCSSFPDDAQVPQLPLYTGAPLNKQGSDRVVLGNTQIEVSRLAMGSGTHGYGGASDQTRLGLEGFSALLVESYDRGITFWETADQYGAHAHLKRAIASVGRKNVVILTKTHANTEKEMWADLDRFRSELGTDRIDIVLLHCMLSANWPQKKAGAMTVLSEAKQKGIIRAHGVSCHDLGAIKVAAASEWVDVDLARLNPAGIQMEGDPATTISVLRTMKQKGKGVIGMKILGAGDLRARADEALQYALAQDVLDCFTIGCETPDEFDDLVKRIPAASVRA